MSARTLVEVDDARERILRAAHGPSAEPVALSAQLIGRVLADDVTAQQPLPPFDNSAMDGFAVRAADVADAAPERPVTLQVVGESRAGHPAALGLAGGQAIAISTGAVMPAGADTVLRVEDSRAADGTVQALSGPAAGLHVRRAGEDVQPGTVVLAAGTAIGPSALGVLASLGYEQVSCARRPHAAVLVSGDELLSPGEPARPGAIRDSSSWTVSGLARRAGAEVLSTALVRDEPGATREAVERALAGAEVLVVCGGVSVGAHDHVRPSLRALGVHEDFWGLALRPGSPAWFGTRDGTLVFGLPGNPVSAMVTFVLLVAPALRVMQGREPLPARTQAIIDGDYEKPAGRAHAVRCTLTVREGVQHVLPTGPQGSHVLSSMLGADVLAMLPSESTGVRAGEQVAIEDLRELIPA